MDTQVGEKAKQKESSDSSYILQSKLETENRIDFWPMKISDSKINIYSIPKLFFALVYTKAKP
jgi:hypothetical protein